MEWGFEENFLVVCVCDQSERSMEDHIVQHVASMGGEGFFMVGIIRLLISRCLACLNKNAHAVTFPCLLLCC